jgi:hypothetical protein
MSEWTTQNEKDLKRLFIELRRIYEEPATNGLGHPDLEHEKLKREQLIKAARETVALATRYISSPMPKKVPGTAAEMYGGPTKIANAAMNPETMEIIRRDGERADIIRARARAQAASLGRPVAAEYEKVTNSAPPDTDPVRAAKARADATLYNYSKRGGK